MDSIVFMVIVAIIAILIMFAISWYIHYYPSDKPLDIDNDDMGLMHKWYNAVVKPDIENMTSIDEKAIAAKCVKLLSGEDLNPKNLYIGKELNTRLYTKIYRLRGFLGLNLEIGYSEVKRSEPFADLYDLWYILENNLFEDTRKYVDALVIERIKKIEAKNSSAIPIKSENGFFYTDPKLSKHLLISPITSDKFCRINAFCEDYEFNTLLSRISKFDSGLQVV